MTTAAAAAEETGALVTIGVKPTWACPGFGYIEQGEAGATCAAVPRRRTPFIASSVFAKNRMPIWRNRFCAKEISAGTPACSSGRCRRVLSEFNRHAPELANFISQLRAPEISRKRLRERFQNLPRISFDYAIMEKADRVLVVEAGFDWDDVGELARGREVFQERRGRECRELRDHGAGFDEQHRVQPDGREVALLGVHNLIVVRTGDAILICHRHEAEKIKNLIGKLPQELQ